ncbi:MAG: hypothetical protein OXL37_04165 [Chloroflexota bacterium]|nr:hypothetical protein [Chloroflexota bacterium]MDE2958485.1 hypothetical protein [Chloroflexota bacterium]
MTYNEYLFDLSEITELERFLASPDISEVEKIGLRRRLEKARKRIAGIAPPPAPVYDDGETESVAALPVAVVNHNGDGERSEQQ